MTQGNCTCDTVTGGANPVVLGTLITAGGFIETGMLGRIVKCSSLEVWTDDGEAEEEEDAEEELLLTL